MVFYSWYHCTPRMVIHQCSAMSEKVNDLCCTPQKKHDIANQLSINHNKFGIIQWTVLPRAEAYLCCFTSDPSSLLK